MFAHYYLYFQKSPIVGTKLRMLSVMMCQCAIMLWCNVHFVADSWRLQCVRKFRGELQCVMKIPGDCCVGEIYIYIYCITRSCSAL